MGNRHIISYALFVLGALLFILFGLLGGQLGAGVLLALAFAMGGIIFHRRGK